MVTATPDITVSACQSALSKRAQEWRLVGAAAILIMAALLGGCASVVSSATSGLAENLSTAILNQNDPETVRDGAPAYLLMLDSFVEGAPDDPEMLEAAAELYAAYGVLFAEDPERADRLTGRALDYGERALCARNDRACGMQELRFDGYQERLQDLEVEDISALYTLSQAWLAWIKVNAGDMGALSKLPRAETALRRVRELDPGYREAEVEHYLGVLSTIRPPALGGRFDEGRAHFERAIELTGGRNLSTQVDFARFYARTLYERELHDRLLNQVLASDPEAEGLTLINVMAQEEARALLASAPDYF
jgi:hypothetical protein